MGAIPLIAATGLMAGGQILGGVAARNQAGFQQDALDAQFVLQQQIAQQNADFHQQVASFNADIARKEAEINARRLERQRAREIGGLTARLAARGVTISGSPVEVLGQARSDALEDIGLVRAQGELQAQRTLFEGDVLARREMQQLAVGGFGNQVAQEAAFQRGQFGLISGVGQGLGTILGGGSEFFTRFGNPFASGPSPTATLPGGLQLFNPPPSRRFT